MPTSTRESGWERRLLLESLLAFRREVDVRRSFKSVSDGSFKSG
jgi:hypothetical protein